MSRFILDLALAVFLLLFAATALCICGVIPPATLGATYGSVAIGVLGLNLCFNRHPPVRATGGVLLGLVALGALFMLVITPADASATADLVWNGPHMVLAALPSDAAPLIAAPPGDTGFWGTVNAWIADGLGGIVVTAVTLACTAIRARTKINIRTDQEQRVIELMKTGAYQGMHELEIAVDDHWTPAQRQKVVDRMVGWAESRGAAELKKLGLPSFVVTGMARKALGQLQAAGLVGADFDPIDAAVTGSAPYGGNPGETPALDRAAGGTGGN